MIFDIETDEGGDFSLSIYENEKEWLKEEKNNLECTYDEEDPLKYLNKFLVRNKLRMGFNMSSDFGYEKRLIIKGEIIVPRIKEIIKEIDL